MNFIPRLLLFVGLIPIASFAQPVQKNYNSLLWRISGNGLSSPSYVYGTMHLTDKRLFNFSDSLYYFLEHSEGFAAEVDMGGFMPEIISGINKKNRDSLIRDIVREEWLKPNRKSLEKLTKKHLEDITVGDLKAISTKFESQLLRSGEMPAIMDVYLFDIARRQGKWVGGIEDFSDQFKPIDPEDNVMSMIYDITTDKSAINRRLEWMIRVYLGQRLDSIDLRSQIWKGADEEILIRRNLKMARRMDSIMQLRTCVFAVGAAHIPGDSGVVRLLRDRGFNVEPVYSAKKIEPGKYSYTSKDIPWISTDIRDGWYSLLMPGKAENLLVTEENLPLVTKLYYDLTRMNAYFTISFPVDSARLGNKDSLFNVMADNFGKQGKVVSSKNITVNKVPGKEFIIKSDESDMRLQAFLPGTSVVLNIMAAFKYDSLFGNDAGHFFESFNVLKAPPSSPAATWESYSFRDQAFSIKFPVPYEEQHPKSFASDSIWKRRFYVATDMKNNISCWMMAMDAKAGYYSDSDSAYFEIMKKSISGTLKNGEIVFTKQDRFKGFPLYEIIAKAKYNNQSLQIKARLINRGNRRYYFYVVFGDDEASGQKADNFLNSFSFLPLESSTWSYQPSPRKDISLWAPAAMYYQPGEDSSLGTSGYMMYDSISPANVLITKKYLSPYYWWKSDSAFFRERAGNYITDRDDSLRDYKMTREGGLAQADFLVVAKDNHNLKKVHLLLNGDTLYSVFTFLPPDLLQTANYNRLFDNIKIDKIKPAGYHLEDKTDRILKDLAEGDSAGFENAQEALGDAAFTGTDLPQLQQALLKPYRYFDEQPYGAHRKLINRVLDLDDGSSLSFVKNHYATLKDSTEKLQYSFLYLLLGLKTQESFDLFKELLSKKLPVTGDPTILKYRLTDSLALSASIFPELLMLSNDTGFIKTLPMVTTSLLDSGLIKTTLVEPYKKNFYALADREIRRLKREAPVYDYAANELVDLLSHFREPAASQLLQQFVLLPPISIKMRAIIALIKNGQKVDALQLEKVAKDDYYRLELYEGLKDVGKGLLFPVKYNTQRQIAQSDIYQVAGDDNNPDSVLFISEKTALFKGKPQRFYLFKVVYNYDGDETERYLGITGPYPTIPGKMIPRASLSGLYNTDSYDVKKINTQLAAYLKEQEMYAEEDN